MICTPGALVEALRRREPDIDVFGLGGERFAAAGGRLVADFHGLSVTGLTEALERGAALVRDPAAAGRRPRATQKPHALVVIDYPDFNFRLMRRIKKHGHPGRSITSARSCGRGAPAASS